MTERRTSSVAQDVAEYFALIYVADNPENAAIVQTLTGGDPQIRAGLIMRLGTAIDTVPQAITPDNLRLLAKAPGTNTPEALDAWREGIREDLRTYRKNAGLPQNPGLRW